MLLPISTCPQQRPQLPLVQLYRRRVPSVLPTMLANSLAALREVPGSISVANRATQDSITRGVRVTVPAKVSARVIGYRYYDSDAWLPLLCVIVCAHICTGASLTSATPTIPIPKCPKCGTIKTSGIISCCARGASWFKKCGASGGLKFERSWADGIEACKASVAGETQAQAMLSNQTDIVWEQQTSEEEMFNALTSNINQVYATTSAFTLMSKFLSTMLLIHIVIFWYVIIAWMVCFWYRFFF